ncbi:glycosyltransferase family 4 protein [Sandaracinus amylolyticus]|uniref:glycosyltransferase family 4 protein n=1 Tax=Sandaracinus amylolyticus TaxID=927083 RepID=UPI001F350492|nr:glycosyltransferase family 4 protein [Sandaracinus amylolyticus]UJR82698.1 Hypothetical protein I5071_47630 [Sandaracinus amylolyticus]
MRITFVVAAADLSGGCRVIAIHARRLRELGHDVRVVAPAPRRPTVREYARAIVRRDPLPRRPSRQSHFDAQGVPLTRLREHRPITERDLPDADVVVATWWETAKWIRDLPRRKGAKAYFVQGWERFIEGQPGDDVDATLALPYHKIVISRFLADVVRRISGDEDVTLARNAIDGAQFDAPPRGRQPRPTLGFVYAASHWKGFDVTREAIERVRKQVPELRVIGFGAEHEETIQPLPRDAKFELRPPQSRIPELYASADVWMSSSRIEGFGLPALEAMACRTPLVATRYGGTPDLVTPGESGYLVDVDDAETLAMRALDVLSMREREWSRMSEAAHRAAHSHTWADASCAFESGLRRAIEKA